MKGPNHRRNLQVNQNGVQGNEQVDENGWPTPLSDPSNPIKIVVTAGQSGTQKDFRAMSTDGQGQLSLAEGHGSVSKPVPEGLQIDVKITAHNSAAKGD